MQRLSQAVLCASLAASTSAEVTPQQMVEAEAATVLAREFRNRGLGQVVEFDEEVAKTLLAEPALTDETGVPVVMMHGMGDFGTNPLGMLPMAKLIGKEANAYVHSVELCSKPNQLSGCMTEDQSNGFLMSMDDQVEQFARVVKSDPKLANGFNAVGMSQGNCIIRGYIHRHNNPPVKTHLSMHGVMMGVAGLPRCPMDMPGVGLLCKTVDELLDLGVYSKIVQDRLAQANYFRDPKDLNNYRKHSHFLPYINNEIEGKRNETYTKNYESLERLVLVMAEDDQMIHPKESEQFGFFEDGSMSKLVAMQDAAWYKENWFGLRTLDKAGKIEKHSTPGDHLRFTQDFLAQMVRKYFQSEANFIV